MIFLLLELDCGHTYSQSSSTPSSRRKQVKYTFGVLTCVSNTPIPLDSLETFYKIIHCVKHYMFFLSFQQTPSWKLKYREEHRINQQLQLEWVNSNNYLEEEISEPLQTWVSANAPRQLFVEFPYKKQTLSKTARSNNKTYIVATRAKSSSDFQYTSVIISFV